MLSNSRWCNLFDTSHSHPATKAYQSFCTNTKAASNCSYWYTEKYVYNRSMGSASIHFEYTVPFSTPSLHLHTAGQCVHDHNKRNAWVREFIEPIDADGDAKTRQGTAGVCACVYATTRCNAVFERRRMHMRRTTHDSVEIEQTENRSIASTCAKIYRSRLSTCVSFTSEHTLAAMRAHSRIRLYPFDDIATMCMSVCARVTDCVLWLWLRVVCLVRGSL